MQLLVRLFTPISGAVACDMVKPLFTKALVDRSDKINEFMMET
jgi:hypothetical protein